MVVAVDVTDDAVHVWSRADDGTVTCTSNPDYRPTCYVAATTADALTDLRARLADDPKIVATAFDRVFTSLRDDERTRVLALEMERPSEITTVAREIRTVHEPEGWAPGTFRLYDVDISPKFRYCLDTGTKPTPNDPAAVRALSLSLATPDLAAGDVSTLSVSSGWGDDAGVTDDKRFADGDPLAPDGDERAVLRALATRLDDVDPDVLVLSSADLVPLLIARADALGVDLQLGRRPGYTQLAGENSYESYGRVGHSPARYDVPGRAIVDRSNSFFWHEGKLPGLFDLVNRSWKPLQESAWASIGTVFTAMQIRAARERGVVVPWRAWEAESFTAARTLHDADRGGLTFEPDVGLHEDVVEIDFASLYPNIMCVNDLSPETVRCTCHDTDDVPGLGYSVCPDVAEPFVPSVLGDLIEDRSRFKDQRRETEDPERRARLDAKISALKWILVTCFGYQGYRNSKFGRIEVHESINAYAREYLLDAKVRLEDAGWRVVHGIVDSLWVAPRERERSERSDSANGSERSERHVSRASERSEPSDSASGKESPVPIKDVCDAITEDIGITLEHESDFEWVAFVPTADGRAGALTKYFGKRTDGTYKYRGIEARQRSTPAFVGAVQETLVETLDEHREPGPVCDRLARAIGRVRSGDVDLDDLVIRTAAAKALDAYDQRTRTVAALERYRDHGIDRHPGQDVRYVVVDDDRSDRDRVRLPWEPIDRYDADFYETLLVRAAESVLSPLGWGRDRIRESLSGGRDLQLAAFEE